METGIRAFNGVLKDFWSTSVDFFKTKYKRQKAIDRMQDFSDLPERVLKDTKAMFVLSTGRCGTDFLTHLLKQSAALHVEHEAEPRLAMASRYLNDNNLLNQEAGKAAFLAARYHMIQDAYMFEKRYVETNNRLTFFAPAIRDLMPQAQFVHIVRHPGAFVRSGMRRGYYTDEYIADFGKIRPTPEDEVYDEWESYSRIEKISWLWFRTNTLIEEFKESCPDKVMMVKSEELFRAPGTVAKDILNFMNETPPSQFKTDLGPKNKQRSGNFAHYDRWSDEYKEKLRSIAGDLAHKYDYNL